MIKMKKIESNLMPLLPINEMKKKVKNVENLWSKIDEESLISEIVEDDDGGDGLRNFRTKMDEEEGIFISAMKLARRSTLKDSTQERFTGLPFSNTVDSTTAVAMVDVKADDPKYVVAPDGYIPNSEVRHENYPPIFVTHPLYKNRRKPKVGDEEEFIKKILSKHLAPDKIEEVKKRSIKRKAKERKKPHYAGAENDVIIMQNEVTDHFNFELELVVSDKVSEKQRTKIPKKKKIPTTSNILQNLKSRILVPKLTFLEEPTTKSTETELVAGNSEEDIDIEILDKLDRQIEEGEKLGILSNEKIHQRILKDRKYRMDDAELNRFIRYLEGIFNSKKVLYNEIMKALNKNSDSLQKLEKHLKSRQKRLEFLNTLTDPQHIFNYLLQFYEKKSELLDHIQDSLMGGDEESLKQLTLFCGEHYKLRDFFAEFVSVKNYALHILSTKILAEKDRVFALEKCLRDETINQNIIFNIFMSNESNAKRFFECIPECRMKEMISIIEQMKEIRAAQSNISETVSKEVHTFTEISTEIIVDKPAIVRKAVHVEKPLTLVLPPLPEYNENSWKLMMSQYIAQMVSNIVPELPADIETTKPYVEDINLLELIKELSFLHVEVMRLLKVYLNDDTNSAKKLLDGLVAEDNLAYQALIELIGDKEAMQIIKSLRLKQAKIIEKIIENHGDKKHISEASMLLKSMSHYLPESLSKNINTWLNAGQVTAEDINIAVNTLTSKERIDEFDESEAKSTEEISLFIFKDKDRRARQSITSFAMSKDEETETTKGPLRRQSFMNRNKELAYRDIPQRQSNIEGIISLNKSIPITKMQEVSEINTDDTDKSVDADFAETSKKELKDIKMTAILDFEILTKISEDKVIEYNICQDICTKSWFKSEPTTNYEEVVLKLTDMITETDNINQAIEITAKLMSVAEHTNDKDVNVVIVNKLVSQVLNLIEEDEVVQKTWLNVLKKRSQEEGVLEKGKLEIPVNVELITDRTINIGEDKTVEDAIKESYQKHKKIKRLLEVLKSFEVHKAEELEKIIKDKVDSCTLFVPEFREHINLVRDLGMEFYQPHELVNLRPDIIMRQKKELIKTVVRSNKEDEMHKWLTAHHDETFWEKASKTSKIRDQYSIESNLSFVVSKEHQSISDNEDEDEERIEKEQEETEILRSFSEASSKSIFMGKESFKQDIIEIVPISPVYKKVSSASVMQIRDAITITPLVHQKEVFKGEFVEEDVIKRDSSLQYEIGYSRLFPKKTIQRRKPKDPYFDFHTLYGSTAYYLPYINPELQRKNRSHEDSYPQYYSTKKQENQVFEDVNKMINGFGRSNTQVTPTLTKTHFIRRPSEIPLSDWIKLGAPGMASNMVLADQSYKCDKSKCRFHHLTKLKLHNYGISAAKHIQRCEVIEFITKANAVTKHENVKSKFKNKSRTISKTNSSVSLLESF